MAPSSSPVEMVDSVGWNATAVTHPRRRRDGLGFALLSFLAREQWEHSNTQYKQLRASNPGDATGVVAHYDASPRAAVDVPLVERARVGAGAHIEPEQLDLAGADVAVTLGKVCRAAQDQRWRRGVACEHRCHDRLPEVLDEQFFALLVLPEADAPVDRGCEQLECVQRVDRKARHRGAVLELREQLCGSGAVDAHGVVAAHEEEPPICGEHRPMARQIPTRQHRHFSAAPLPSPPAPQQPKPRRESLLPVW
jgi:hypothetical protein